MYTITTAGADSRDQSAGNFQESDITAARAFMADRLQVILDNPVLPEQHREAIEKWLADGGAALNTAGPEDLNKLVASLEKTKLWPLGDALTFDVAYGPVNHPAESHDRTPDTKQARRFVALLTGSPDTVMSFQTFDDSKERKENRKGERDPFAKEFHGTIDGCAEQLTKMNQTLAGVFITVNQTDGTGRKAENIVKVRAVFADFDGDDALARAVAAKAKLQPTIEVSSSGDKRHLYWLVSDCTLEMFGPLLDKLVEVVGSDKGAKGLNRVLRLPGFFHCKGVPRRVQIINASDGLTYTVQQVADAFGIDLSAIATKAKAKTKAKTKRHAEPSTEVDYDPLDFAINESTAARLRSALGVIIPKSRDNWIKVCAALCRSGEVGFRLFHEWSATAGEEGGYAGEDDCRAKFDELEPDSHSHFAAIFTMAQELGWTTGTEEVPGEEQLAANRAVIEEVIDHIAKDPGAAFTKEAIAAFALIKKRDLPEYQRVMLKLRPHLVKSGIERAIRDTERAEREAENERQQARTHHYWAKELAKIAKAASNGVWPVSTRGKIYRYVAGLWEGINGAVLSTQVATHFDGQRNCDDTGDYNAIAKHAMNLYLDETFFDDAPVGIACGSTFYRCTPSEVIGEPLGPQHRQVERIPYPPKKIPTPLFDRFLHETFMETNGRGADRIELMQEIFGAVLLRLLHRYHKAVLFYDPFGRAGKGTISKIIEQLIPRDVTVAIPLHDWDDQYRLAVMAGAWLNLVGEVDPDKVMATGVFKNVTGGDLLTGREIYCAPFKFLPLCSHIFSGNAFPPTRDHSDAFFSRWLIVHFPNSRTRLALEINTNLANEIIATEMPGIVAWALAGAQRLLANGGFTVTAEHAQMINEWRRATNSIEQFIVERCEIGEAFRVSKPQFYRAYNDWCRENGHKPTSKYEAGKRLLAIGGLRITEVDSKGVAWFKGIQLNVCTFADFEEPANE